MKTSLFSKSNKEKGLVSLVFIGIWSVVLISCVIALDAVRLYSTKQNIQQIADLVAMELTSVTNVLSGTLKEGLDLDVLANEMLMKHGFDVEYETKSMSVEFGSVAVSNGITSFNPDATIPYRNAIKITLTQNTQTFFIGSLNKLLGGVFDEHIVMKVEAVAAQVSQATFQMGTGLLAVNAENSILLNLLLKELLKTNLDLDVLSFKGVLNLSSTVLQIMQDIGVVGVGVSIASVDELLNAKVNLASMIGATIKAAERGNTANASIDILRQLQSEAGIRSAEIVLGEVLSVYSSTSELSNEALKASVNVFDLLMATLMAANKENAIRISISDDRLLNRVSGLVGINVGLDVLIDIGEAPVIAVGPPGKHKLSNNEWITEARSAQAKVFVGSKLTLPLGLIDVDLGLLVSTGSGRAGLSYVDFEKKQAHIEVYPSLADIKLGSRNSMGEDPASISVGLLGIPVADILIGANITTQGLNGQANSSKELKISFSDMGSSNISSGSVGNSVTGLIRSLGNTELKIRLLGLELPGISTLLSSVLSLLTSILTPLLDAIGSVVVDPLLNFLGVGGTLTEVTLMDVNHTSVVLVR